MDECFPPERWVRLWPDVSVRDSLPVTPSVRGARAVPSQALVPKSTSMTAPPVRANRQLALP
jgi:hypothetical protein